MIVEYLRTLYAYSNWANNRVLDTAEKLSAEQFTASVGTGFPSVRDTLAHTLSAQWHWLHRFQKQPRPTGIVGADFADVAALRARWQGVNDQTQAFLVALTEEKLAEVISMQDREGNTFHYTLWQMMAHQANHAQQHRSEVAAMLTQFGHSPGDLDFLDYVDLKAEGA